MANNGMRFLGFTPREWDRIVKSLEFAADHSRDHCTRENNVKLAAEIRARLDTDAVKRQNSIESSRRHRERERKRKAEDGHDPDANNLEFSTRHPMEVR